MSLEINWFDIELRGLCIINTHIMTCSCKFIYIVQTRRLVNMHSHTYLLRLQSLVQLLTTSLLMGAFKLTRQLKEVLIFVLPLKPKVAPCSAIFYSCQSHNQKKPKTNVQKDAQQFNNTTEKSMCCKLAQCAVGGVESHPAIYDEIKLSPLQIHPFFFHTF